MKTTINDIGRSECEQRQFETTDRVSAMGRTSEQATCPFCGETMRVYVWSLRGSGKRCDCGALLRGETSRARPTAYRLPNTLPSDDGEKNGMAYFTPRPGRYMSGYVFTTTRISGSRINGEIRAASSGEFLGSFGFEIDDVLEIHHPQGYGFDTDEPYVPGGQDE